MMKKLQKGMSFLPYSVDLFRDLMHGIHDWPIWTHPNTFENTGVPDF